MTTQPVEQPVIEPAPLQHTPSAKSRLAQLHAAYTDAKAASAAAEAQLKAITDAIKLELTSLDAEQRRFELLPAKGITAPPLRLTYTESWRLDSRKLKKEAPETYVRYASKSGSWRLTQSSADGGDE